MNWMRNRYSAILLLGLLALSLALTAHGNTPAPLAPEPVHIKKAQLISGLLSQHHYRTQIIDKQLSKTVFDAYLKMLDRDRYYLLAEDIETFSRYREQLDNGFRKGDMTAAYRIFSRYQQRVEERVRHVEELLDQELAFDADARIELDRSEAAWAQDRDELDELWRKRIKHDALTLQMAGQEPERVKEILSARYERIGRITRQHTAEDVFETYMNAWAHTFDPHTAYMSPRLSENFDIHMRLSLEGIGAVLRSENDMTEVMSLVPGGPAAKHGVLQPGDRILGVGQGEDGDMVDVVGWLLQDVVDLIRGPKETVVKLQILSSSGDATPQQISLVRNEVKLEEQAAQANIIEIDQGEHAKRIGVIKIPAFYMDFYAADAGDKNYRSTTRDVRKLIAELEQDGVDGLLIDLRGNGGGSLREATELTGLFLPGAPVVQVRRSSGDVEILRDSSKDLLYSGPLAVMVDRFSASASEIFAGAIQDHGRGLVIGQQTFGKGTVQNLVDLDHFDLRAKEPMGRLKLTIAKFYRVSGSSTQQRGVIPDIVLPSPVRSDQFGENAVSNALPWGSIKPVSYQHDASLALLLPELLERHDRRSADDVTFQALEAEYRHVRNIQQRDSAPLSEKARQVERDRLQAEQLTVINRRRAIHGLPELESLDDHKPDEMPDVLLQSAAAVVADLQTLRAEGGKTRLQAVKVQ